MVREDHKESEQQIRAMWRRNFHDPEAYEDFYFEEIYRKNEVLVCPILDNQQEETGQYKGMLHLNPYGLNVRGERISAHYIVGVATDRVWRRQGVMRELIYNALNLLRRRGEVFCYLMPADPAYYRPFGFRYGADWLEVRMVWQPDGPGENIHVVSRFDNVGDAEIAAARENKQADPCRFVSTWIDTAYYEVLEKEAISDHADVCYVYDQGEYAGRFLAAIDENEDEEEDDCDGCLLLSRINCCQKDRRAFIQALFAYCYDYYGCRDFRLILDESWEDVFPGEEEIPGTHILSIKRKPMIMFRILNLEEAGRFLEAGTDFSMVLKVRDRQVTDQSGTYYLKALGGICTIDRLAPGQEGSDRNSPALGSGKEVCHGGEISIGDLTDIFFGRDRDSISGSGWPPGLTREGRRVLQSIRPLQGNCIMEYI